MTNQELHSLAYRAAAAFELEPKLFTRKFFVKSRRDGQGKCFCALGAMAALAGAMPPGTETWRFSGVIATWVAVRLTSGAWTAMAEANDDAADARDAAQRIRAAAGRLWGE